MVFPLLAMIDLAFISLSLPNRYPWSCPAHHREKHLVDRAFSLKNVTICAHQAARSQNQIQPVQPCIHGRTGCPFFGAEQRSSDAPQSGC